MSSPCWTASQLLGIRTTGHSLLLSAAAGSGKTAVLAERCAHLVCDDPARCDIDRLLVVTFTESAAAEMKSRIQAALRRRLEAGYSDRLARQVALAEHAHVSTVHGFCFRLLRQNFTLAGIDPKFEMLDAEEAALLRREVAADLFHRRYELDETGQFQHLIDSYGDGNDTALIEKVISTHNLLCSLISPDDWIASSMRQMAHAAELPLEESDLGRSFFSEIRAALAALVRKCNDAQRTIRALGPSFDPYLGYLADLEPYFSHWTQVLSQDGLDMLVSEIEDFRRDRPRVPAVRKAPQFKELAKSIVDSIKGAVDEYPLKDLLSARAEHWQAGMRRMAPFADVFLGLVRDFGAEYSAAKASQRALDFADLERLTLNILSEGPGPELHPSPLARSLHDQFRHVLVDEYQDINPIQNEILRLVSRECRGPQDGNLFCVGDVKQSIFRFRLAEPKLFIARNKQFATAGDPSRGQVIALRENFRSRAPLLTAINGVFERLMTADAAEIDYDQSHRLASGREFPPSSGQPSFAGAPIELHLLPDEPGEAEGLPPLPDSDKLERVDYEAILLARRIKQLMGHDGAPRMNVASTDASGNPVLAPIQLSDIVILLRAMQGKADRFADVLRAHDVPVHNEAGGGLFDATEIRDVLAVLQILDNQQQDIPLATVLRSPLAALPEADDSLARIRLAFPEVPFHRATARYAAEREDELAAFLRDFLARLADWRDQANKRPVAELLWHLYDQAGYLAFVGGLEDGAQRTANLIRLHERANQFGKFQRQGLYRFLRFLESLREETDLARPSPIGQADQVVRIMSIHRSKGLEFPVVFLPDLGKAINVSDSYGSILVDRHAGLGMSVVEEDRLISYPSLASMLVSQNLFKQTKAEELRLLYVAMTRAKEHLIMIATCGPDEPERWSAQYSGHVGPLPPENIVSATRAIDWLGPVAAMTAKSDSPIFALQAHKAQDVRTWQHPRHHREAFTDRQNRLARFEPLPDDPPPTPEARELIQRFESAYPFQAFTNAPATASVTSLAKGDAPTSEPTGSTLLRKLDLPRFFQPAAPKATDIGTATHTLLQYLDFADDPAQIEFQITRLVSRNFLSEEQAALVDRPAVAWFLQSDLAR
ncbi:MAG: helicase-exonuclease AddAB subunit AddA, partial [Verrucomicrobiota bacterium]